MHLRRTSFGNHPQPIDHTLSSRSRPRWFGQIVLLLICIELFGCGTVQIHEYPKSSAASMPNAMTKNDLTIAVHVISDKKDLEQYFGTDLTDVKILPVYVAAENRSASSSFLLSKDRMSLKHESGSVATGGANRVVRGESGGGELTAKTGVAVLPFVAPITPILLATGLKATSDASAIKQNMEAKAFQTRTVSPGKTVDGFIYFAIPDQSQLKGYSVLIEAQELGSSATHRFTLTLDQ